MHSPPPFDFIISPSTMEINIEKLATMTMPPEIGGIRSKIRLYSSVLNGKLRIIFY